MQKVSLLLSIKDLTWEHQVNYVTEATPLLTEKTDVTSLNQLAYAEAITVIKTVCTENECIIKKQYIKRGKRDWTFNLNWPINDLCANTSKISQMNDPRPSTKMKRITNSMKTKYQIFNEQTRFTSLEALKQRLCALNNRLSRYQRRHKQYQQTNEFIKEQTFWRTMGEPNHHHEPTNQVKCRNILEATIREQK